MKTEVGRKEKSHYLWPGLISALWMFVAFAVLLTELMKEKLKHPYKLKKKKHKRSQLENVNLTLQSGYEEQCISYVNLEKMKSVLN